MSEDYASMKFPLFKDKSEKLKQINEILDNLKKHIK